MSVHKLLLVPADQSILLDQNTLANTLATIGLTGKKLPVDQPQVYQTGEKFLQLITFLGCSPNIQLEPPVNMNELTNVCQNGKLCHVRLMCNNKDLRYRCNTGAIPRCPHCKAIDNRWHDYLDTWSSNPEMIEWQCAECMGKSTIYALNFRKQAAFIRDCIEIRGIHPSEAIPGEILMDTLRNMTDCSWQVFYIKD